METTIRNLVNQIEELSKRVTELENAAGLRTKTSLFQQEEKEKIKVEKKIMVKNLKQPILDRFNKIHVINEEITIAYYNKNIDNYEKDLMTYISLEKEGCLSVERLMHQMNLNLEQIMEMIKKLEKLKYIEVYNADV